MKKIIILVVFALCAFCLSVGIQSCKKKESVDTTNLPKIGVFEGDEYDQGLVVEEPDEPEEEIDDTDYQADVKKPKIDSIVPSSSANICESFLPYGNSGCTTTTYKYAGRYRIHQTPGRFNVNYKYFIHFSLPVALTGAIITNKADFVAVSDLTMLDSTKYSFLIKDTASTILRTKVVKITVTDTQNRTFSKSIKVVGKNGQSDYGKSMWGIEEELRLLGRNTTIGAANYIDTTYVPKFGDIVSFISGNDEFKMGIIATIPIWKPATRTKVAGNKIKLIEWNARCNFRKTTKSQTVNEKAIPVSVTGEQAIFYYRN